MSASDSTGVALPKLAVTNLQALGQHAGTLLSGVLVTYGLVQSSQTTEIVDIVSSVVLAGGSLAWAYVMNKLRHQTAVAAVKTAAITGVAPK